MIIEYFWKVRCSKLFARWNRPPVNIAHTKVIIEQSKIYAICMRRALAKLSKFNLIQQRIRCKREIIITVTQRTFQAVLQLMYRLVSIN
jgi:hypothetical protein